MQTDSLTQRLTLAVPFGATSDFVLASKQPPSVFNFYPSLENAAADADRANGKLCYECRHVFTDADKTETFHQEKQARRCSACGKLTWPSAGEYVPMTWDDFVKAQRDCYLADGPVQITRAKWWEALEVLPPDEYEQHGNLVSFLICEHYSGPYTSQYVKRGHGEAVTYWTKMVDSRDRLTWMTSESLEKIEAAALDLCITCGVQPALMIKPYGKWQRGSCDACVSGHHCDKRCGRQARPGSDLCGECGRVPA